MSNKPASKAKIQTISEFTTGAVTVPDIRVDLRLGMTKKLVRISSDALLRDYIACSDNAPNDSDFSGLFDTVKGPEATMYKCMVSGYRHRGHAASGPDSATSLLGSVHEYQMPWSSALTRGHDLRSHSYQGRQERPY